MEKAKSLTVGKSAAERKKFFDDWYNDLEFLISIFNFIQEQCKSDTYDLTPYVLKGIFQCCIDNVDFLTVLEEPIKLPTKE